jgi:hypothetical protein
MICLSLRDVTHDVACSSFSRARRGLTRTCHRVRQGKLLQGECCCKVRGGRTHCDSNAVFVTLCPGRCTGRGGGGGMHAAVACLPITLHSVSFGRSRFSTVTQRIALLAVTCQRHSSTRCAAPAAASPPPSALRPPPVVERRHAFPPAAEPSPANPPPTPCRSRSRAKNAVTRSGGSPFKHSPLHTAELGTGLWFKIIDCMRKQVETKTFFKNLKVLNRNTLLIVEG